ncbi:lysophospholipase [Herbiconiux sp. CPCC 205763]|uniref:Lysophospholipase n=1 Tax=Herbiconiux aconitum TaxID=2970913 RepID=A0ABT2GV45_9MICO|nr:lysophospholipase [Herbiconiux aconitum]MCS5719417.1 lysophospholipase [Herbiconiux aconitum]
MTVASPYAVELSRMPVTTRVLPVAGSTTHLWEYGESGSDADTRANAGTLLVVVHGYRGDHHGLEPVIAQLNHPGYRIVAPDLPGFGVSTPLRAVHDLDGYVEWLHEFVDVVRAESPLARLVIVGHSFGSIVVAAALAGGPGTPGTPGTPGSPNRPGIEVDDAVLINPIAAPALKGPRGVMSRVAIGYYRLGAAAPEKLGHVILSSPVMVRVISITMAKTKNKALRRWIHDQHHRYFSAFANRTVVLDAFRASVSNDVGEYAARITAPTLLIAADKDDITPLAAQHRLRDTMPDARLVVLDDVGHLIHYERPIEAARAIEAFLQSTAGTTPAADTAVGS